MNDELNPQRLVEWADDPMWVDHVEIPKPTLISVSCAWARDRAQRDNLRHHLQMAVDRLEDMLMDDDGQAWDEAEKVMPRLRKALEES